MSAICKCGELASRDEYTNRIERCERCDEWICDECAWCGENGGESRSHYECMEDDAERSGFTEGRALLAQHEERRRKLQERVRLRWNAEAEAIRERVEAVVNAEIGIGPKATLPLWRDEQDRRAKCRCMVEAEHALIENEERAAMDRERYAVAEGGAS